MIVLDTHALVWWVSDKSRLSNPAQKAIDAELAAPGGVLLVSAISAWEVAMLVKHGRLVLSMPLDEWWQATRSIERLNVAPLTDDLLIESTRLPGEFHKDPADRFIVALARERNAPVVTADKKIQAYPHVKCVW